MVMFTEIEGDFINKNPRAIMTALSTLRDILQRALYKEQFLFGYCPINHIIAL